MIDFQPLSIGPEKHGRKSLISNPSKYDQNY